MEAPMLRSRYPKAARKLSHLQNDLRFVLAFKLYILFDNSSIILRGISTSQSVKRQMFRKMKERSMSLKGQEMKILENVNKQSKYKV